MSLKSVGRQLLQTAPSLLLAGASKASVSFWVRVNPVNNVADPNGVMILGEDGGHFSATMSRTGGLRLQWSSNDGHSDGISSYLISLLPGTTHHLAATWETGSQRYYLNGVPVQADTQVGSLGMLGEVPPQPFRIESDQVGSDVSLDEPTLWVGHALTVEEVVSLHDRSVDPGSIASESIALLWSLAALDLSSIIGEAPTYQATSQEVEVGNSNRDESATSINPSPPVMFGSGSGVAVNAAVAPSGEAVILTFEDGTGKLTNVSAIGDPSEIQSITLSGNPSGGTFTLTSGSQTTTPIAVTATPPPQYALFTIPVTPGHPIQLAVTFPSNLTAGAANTGVLYEVFDGTAATLLGQTVLSQLTASNEFTDVGPLDPNGNWLLYDYLGNSAGTTYYTSTTGTILVRISAQSQDGGDYWFVNALRSEDTITSTIERYQAPGPNLTTVGTPPTVVGSGAGWSHGNYISSNNTYGGEFLVMGYGQGAGTSYSINPGNLQSALTALSTIGAGNLTVSGSSASYSINYTGALANMPQPLLVSSDPEVVVGLVQTGIVRPVLSINGGAPITLTNWLYDTSGSYPAILFPLSQSAAPLVIGPTDTARITLADGWVTTVAGVVSGATNLPITPPSPSTINPPFVVGSKNAAIGYNVRPDSYFSSLLTYSNIATRMQFNYNFVVATNPDGYPTQITYSPYAPFANQNQVLGFCLQGDGTVIPNCPYGLYTFLWDGASDLQFDTSLYNTVATLISSNITGTINNQRVYRLSPSATNAQPCPQIIIKYSGTTTISSTVWNCNLANLRIYPPDPNDSTGNTAWVNPPKFHPSIIAKAQGAQCIRFLDVVNVNNNPFRDFDQIMPESYFGRSNIWTSVGATVATIEDPTVPRWFPNTPGSGLKCPTVVQITTTTPHGLYDGASINIACGTADFSGRSNVSLNGPNFGLVKVFNDYIFLLEVDRDCTTVATMTNTLTGGSISALIGTCWPLQDMVDFVVTSGANELWFNVPVTADFSVGGCVDQIASFFAAKLPVGYKIHVEYGNECWNFGFATYGWTRALTSVIAGFDNGTYQVAYANNAQAVHARFQAMFAAAGRPNDVIHTYCTQGINSAVTTAIVSVASTNKATIDELGVGIYFDNHNQFTGPETSQLSILDNLTISQCLDYLELNAEYNGIADFVSLHLPILEQYGYGATKMVAYEGSPDDLVPGSQQQSQLSKVALYSREYAIQRHPRMFGVLLRVLQKCEDAGLTLWNQYALGVGSFSNQEVFAWDAYEWWNEQRGTGNPTLDAINISNFEATNQIVAEIGGALHYWSTLNPSRSIITKKFIPGRNGMIRSIGFPRGTLRTIR